MRFSDLTALALRGLPSRNLLQRRRKRHIRNFHSTRFRSTYSEEFACPQREDFGSPLATQTDGFLDCRCSYTWCKHPAQEQARQEPLMAFMDPFDDIQVGVRYAPLLPASRAPGFASPGTFPSRRFSHPQGFAPPSPFTALFHAATIHRISSTSLKGLQDKSDASHPWLLCTHLRGEA
jgi:hypothetical protein